MARLPCFGWVVMPPATTKLWHHNQVQQVNFIVLFSAQLSIKFAKLKEYLKNVEVYKECDSNCYIVTVEFGHTLLCSQAQ